LNGCGWDRVKEDVVAINEFGSSTFNTDRVADAAIRAQEEAKRYGQRALDAVESGRQSAASTLDSAASGIRSKADSLPGGADVSRFARRAADKIGGAAQYLREHEVKDMMSEAESFIKEHPTQALIGAALVGFLAGRSMRR
jgi:ElaB/YqjD/DUF883 family membrane-anchored ribosome-binding protein